MTEVSVNGRKLQLEDPIQLRALLGGDHRDDLDIWLSAPDGQTLSALVHVGAGWLMYLREPGDVGLHSVNPAYSGDPTSTLPFRLANGQTDWYPTAWTLPRTAVIEVLADFCASPQPSPAVHWAQDPAVPALA